MQDQVCFAGYRDDMPAVAAAADIAVLSSDNEGTPVSLIEAAAAGTPAVATALAACRTWCGPRRAYWSHQATRRHWAARSLLSPVTVTAGPAPETMHADTW